MFWNFDPYQCHGGGVNSGFKIVQLVFSGVNTGGVKIAIYPP